MILHIISDSIFIDKGIFNFERIARGENITLLVSRTECLKKLQSIPDIIVRNNFALLAYKYIKIIKSAEAIVLHSLTPAGILASLIAKKQTKILWIGWGFDYYAFFAKKGYSLYGPRTTGLLESDVKPLSSYRNIRRFIYMVIQKMALRKITFFSPVIQEDFELFLSYFPNNKMRYYPWNYGVSLSKNDTEMLKVQGNNILIGNSASYTNNHLEIFEILKNIDLAGRKLIVPLSYGDAVYRDQIIKIGNELFGDAFYPLIDFMPYEEYQRVLQSCSVTIMNHYRQQATGNVSMMLRMGGKVFLSERNPLYRALGRREIKVFTIEELTNDPASLFVPLTGNEKKQNCINLKNTINQQIIDKQTSDIIAALLVDK